MLNSIEEIKAAHGATGGNWFSPATMRFWETVVEPRVYPTASGTYFVTSDRTVDDRRMYSVRFCDLWGRISTLVFQEFRSADDARRSIELGMLMS